jgi:hypothetical protein
MLKTFVGDNAMGRTHFWVFLSIKTWRNFGRNFWAFWSSLDRSHRRKRGECSQNRRVSMKHHYGVCWQVRSLVWNIPAENVWNDGGTRTGCFTMTMRRRTPLCLCSDFWPLKTWLWSPTSLFTWFGPLQFLLVSENEIEAKRASFPGGHWNSGKIADRPTRDSKKSVPAVLPAVAETLDPLHILGRWLLILKGQ